MVDLVVEPWNGRPCPYTILVPCNNPSHPMEMGNHKELSTLQGAPIRQLVLPDAVYLPSNLGPSPCAEQLIDGTLCLSQYCGQ